MVGVVAAGRAPLTTPPLVNVPGLPFPSPSPERIMPRAVPVRGRAAFARQLWSLDALHWASKTDRSVLDLLYHNRSPLSSLIFVCFRIIDGDFNPLGAFALCLGTVLLGELG